MNSTGDIDSATGISGPALFRMVRVLGRRPVTQDNDRLIHIMVVEAVGELGAPDVEVTIGSVAERLKLASSTASRMVTATMQEGYVVAVPSEADSRRRVLELTAPGRQLLSRAVEFQQQVFDELVADWPAEDVREFSRLLVAFAEAVQRL